MLLVACISATCATVVKALVVKQATSISISISTATIHFISYAFTFKCYSQWPVLLVVVLVLLAASKQQFTTIETEIKFKLFFMIMKYEIFEKKKKTNQR